MFRYRAVIEHKHRFETMTVGSITYRNAPVSVSETSLPGFDMLLAMNFWRGRKLWLSYKTGQVFIQYMGRPLARPGMPPNGVPSSTVTAPPIVGGGQPG